MLERIDRVQVVVRDAADVAGRFGRLLGAEVDRRDAVRCLGARRAVLRLGGGEVELLEPDGAGAVADFLAGTGGGLFAAGVAVRDVRQLRRHLGARGEAEGSQLFLPPEVVGVPGLRVVVSPEAAREPVGLVRGLYEATSLVADAPLAVERIAATFSLDPAAFVPIRSAEYGYEGTLTLFDPARLDRFEVITPFDAAKTMGRFFARRGPSLYMGYAEADEPGAIRERLLEHAPDDWTGVRDAPVDNLFVHPKALGGMMMGVSRVTVAWTWSGRPDRVVARATS